MLAFSVIQKVNKVPGGLSHCTSTHVNIPCELCSFIPRKHPLCVQAFSSWKLILEVLLWLKHYGVNKEAVLIESTGVIGHRIKKVLLDRLISFVALQWVLILCDFFNVLKIAWKGWQDLYRIRSLKSCWFYMDLTWNVLDEIVVAFCIGSLARGTTQVGVIPFIKCRSVSTWY